MTTDTSEVVFDRFPIAGGIGLGVTGSRAGHALAPDHRRFLIGEGDQLEIVLKTNAVVLQRATDFQTCQNP